MQRTKKALTWLEGIIGASDVCGLTMTDIVRQYENDQLHKSSTEMKIYGHGFLLIKLSESLIVEHWAVPNI